MKPYVKRSASREAAAIRTRPALARQWWSAKALLHMAADETCGRAWACACAACRSARAALR